LNVATLNQNNSASVVLPPLMDKVVAWYDASSIVMEDADTFDAWHDKARVTPAKTMNLVNSDEDNDPDYAVQPSSVSTNAFYGHRVMSFDQSAGTEKFFDSAVDFSTITKPLDGVTLIENPEYTVALCLCEHSGLAAGQEQFFLMEGADSVQLVIKRFNTSCTWVLANYTGSATNTGNDSGGSTSAFNYHTIGTETLITSVRDTGSAHGVEAWKNGTQLSFTGSGTTMFTVASGKQDLDDLSLGKNWHGGMSEVIIWKGRFSNANAVEAHKYLADKWGHTVAN